MRRILKQPTIITAIICAMVSYALMNLMMTSAPLAVVGCGFTTDTAASIVSFHVIAMFLPSFFTGNLIARFGVEKIIAAGLVVLLLAGLMALQGVDLFNFYGALILLGLGWNFGFIGATALLASAHAPEERAKVQGLNDFLVFGLVAFASFSSGGLMNGVGADDVILGWTAVNIAMVPFLALAAGTLLWFVLRKPALTPAQ
jgi:MFS family permease